LVNKAIDAAKHDLLSAGFTRIDYIEVRDAETLAPFAPKSGRKGRILAAAWLGKTRLIDNVAV
jgi:pantoate--beta-alanine ligase